MPLVKNKREFIPSSQLPFHYELGASCCVFKFGIIMVLESVVFILLLGLCIACCISNFKLNKTHEWL